MKLMAIFKLSRTTRTIFITCHLLQPKKIVCIIKKLSLFGIWMITLLSKKSEFLNRPDWVVFICGAIAGQHMFLSFFGAIFKMKFYKLSHGFALSYHWVQIRKLLNPDL